MKLLWLARTIPLPLDAGDRIYTAKLAEHVAAAGASVTFMGLSADQPGQLSDEVNWQSIGGPPANTIRFLFSRLPMAGVRHCTEAYQCAIRHAIDTQSWDAIVLDQYSMVWVLDVIRESDFSGVVAHVAHDFETKVTQEIVSAFRGNLVKRRMLAINAKRTEASERRLAAKCDVIVTLTAKDQLSFSGIGGNNVFAIIPPGYSGRRKQSRLLSNNLPRRVVVVGSFDWIAKQMNLRAFLKIADTAFGASGIELHIVGSIPKELRVDLSRQVKSTIFLGYVDNLDEIFNQARIGLVFEETGGGFKLKLLEYLYNRVPIAGLAKAMIGLPPEIIAFAICAETTEQLVAEVISAIDDIERLNFMQNNAIAAAAGVRQFDWMENGRTFIAAIEYASDVRHRRVNGVPSRRHI